MYYLSGKVSASREKHKISLLIFDSERSLTSHFEAKVAKNHYFNFIKRNIISFINYKRLFLHGYFLKL